MSDPTAAPIVLRLTATDQRQLQAMALDLRAELAGLGLAEVRQLPAEPSPEGTRALEVVAVAFLLTALGTTADLISVIQAARGWRARDRQRQSVSLTVAGAEIGLSDENNVDVLRAVATAKVRSRPGNTRQALIIANATYADAAISRLRSPAFDADALASVLGEPGIGGFNVQLCLDETEHAIRRRIGDFFADRDRDDLLLVHYSGHGLKDTRGRLHLAGRDTDLRRLTATSVPAAFLSDQITETASNNVVLILDCCYSGAFARGALVRSDRAVHVAEEFGGRGRVVLTASTATEYAFDGDELAESHGTPSIFTSALVRGLRTGAADLDADGEITIDELYDYTFREVRRKQPDQTPLKWTFGLEGSLVIAHSVRGAELPASIIEDLKSNRVGLRLEAVEELRRLLDSDRPALREAAREALRSLNEHDDSSRARDAAAAALAHATTPAHPTEPDAARLAKAEPAAVRNVPAVVEPETPGLDPPLAAENPVPAAASREPGRRIRRRTLVLAGIGAAVTAAAIPTAIGLLNNDDTLSGDESDDPITSVAFSRDGKTLVTASYLEKNMWFWEAATGRHVATVAGHDGGVRAMAFSPDGKILASGSSDMKVALWDSETLRTFAHLTGHTKDINSVVFSPDGKTLASGGHDMTVRLWDVASRSTTFVLSGHTDVVTSVAFSPDGKTLATSSAGKPGSHNTAFGLWDVATGKSIGTFTISDQSAGWVIFAPDGKALFAVAAYRKELHKWDLATAEHSSGPIDTDGITALTFSPDGKTLATGGYSKKVILRDATSLLETVTLTGNTSQIAEVVFSPDGKLLATGAYHGARVWDLATSRTIYTITLRDGISASTPTAS